MIPTPRVSVVIPTHNGAATLVACLESLQASTQPPHEIVVVDDASSDGSSRIAEGHGCRVIRLDENVGAARAKNRGAAAAKGEILFFTDDDVRVAPDALERIGQALSDQRAVGVVGVLSAEIPFDDFASNYKNLWMRYTYERLPRERIGVFYTSIAAIRREVFRGLGGFDENYRGASIAEDTEFGQRVWGAGLVLFFDSHISATHLKRYTPLSLLATDCLRARALLLMRLRKRGHPFYSSVPLFYQIAVLTLLALLASLAASAANGWFLFAAVAFLLLFYVLFRSWFAYLARVRGNRFALAAALFQPADVIAVGLGMGAGLLEFARGTRY